MVRSHPSLSRIVPTIALSCVAAAPLPLLAQAHVQETADHVLRASTVSAGSLPPAMLKEHSIPTDPNTAVLNVTVQRKVEGRLRNVPAQVDVEARNLLGAPTSVQMRQVVANGLVSYLGVYRFLPREVLNFRITARPGGSDRSITLEFRDRMSAP